MTDKRAVFVVHGRNTSVRESMFGFLRALDLKPMEWEAAVGLTGKASPYIGEVLDAAFAHAQAVVVLMTPDETAYLDEQWSSGPHDDQTVPAPQARPNVPFEAGMALGRNPDHTLLVEVGRVRDFSDVGGRHAIRLTNDSSSRQSFATRLRSAGLDVDTSGTQWLTIGDFTASGPGGGLPLGKRTLPGAEVAPAVRFALSYRATPASGSFDKLRITNRGVDTAYNVSLDLPSDAALDLSHVSLPIEKIPGDGQSVTLGVFNNNRLMGFHGKDAFDVTITATTATGEGVSQEVFLDLNG